MNKSAERHLAKAAGYVAKGEEFYRKAAEEIVAAREADPALTQRQIGERFGRTQHWVSYLLKWYQDPDTQGSVFSTDTPRRKADHAKQVLREAPLEQIEQIITELPPQRQQDVAAAAGHAYHKARQDHRETERNLSPAQRQERKAAAEAMTRPVVDWSDSMRLVSNLETAVELLRELNSGGEVKTDVAERVGGLMAQLVDEYRVMRAMAGLDIDLDEVTA